MTIPFRVKNVRKSLTENNIQILEKQESIPFHFSKTPKMENHLSSKMETHKLFKDIIFRITSNIFLELEPPVSAKVINLFLQSSA